MTNIVRSDDMPNIRYILEESKTTLWDHLGLPEYQVRDGKRQLVAPGYKQFYDWWRMIRATMSLPAKKDGVWTPGTKRFRRVQLLKGGYYNQDSNGQVIGTMICSATVWEDLPLTDGIGYINLPDEEEKS